ncbi:MAG: PadR family transcriptional regulator [Chthonomonas sp.]|nr:PadR family transcriptional regulator [Chthonomonas sp.]
MKERKASVIEMSFLGMTWLRGPCTVYAVMKELSASESTYHRSRAGTAYQAAKRLEQLGLIERIEGELIQITPEGEAALRDWTGPDVPMMDVAHTADLLRLRCFFLASLPPEQRLEFIDKSLAKLEEFMPRCRNLIKENEKIGDYYGALATVCLVLETEARMNWLRTIRPWIAKPIESDWAEAILAELDR